MPRQLAAALPLALARVLQLIRLCPQAGSSGLLPALFYQIALKITSLFGGLVRLLPLHRPEHHSFQLRTGKDSLSFRTATAGGSADMTNRVSN